MMRRLRKTKKKVIIEESSSDDDEPLKKKASPSPPLPSSSSIITPKIKITKKDYPNDSSSESDLDNYLKPADQINLNSSFFNISPKEKDVPSFDEIEKNILSEDRLSDSGNESDHKSKLNITPIPVTVQSTTIDEEPSTSYNFHEIKTYNSNIEEAMRFVQQYKANKAKDDLQVNDLLAIGESSGRKVSSTENLTEEILTDSDDEEDWEEVETVQTARKDVIEKKDIEIVISTNNMVKKKNKGVDLMMMLKRKLNRVKKENQTYIHKVSILCWIAHGNYVNNVLNDKSLLGLSLSLLPSKQSYPNKRIDLKYLEQISNWYKNFMKIKEPKDLPDLPLEKLLNMQITKQEAWSNKFLVYMFVCIMRSLGISCRLIISLQPEPLKPVSSELFSLSTKNNETQETDKRVTNTKKTTSTTSTKKVNANTANKKVQDEKNMKKKATENDLAKKDSGDNEGKPSTSKATRSKTKKDAVTDKTTKPKRKSETKKDVLITPSTSNLKAPTSNAKASSSNAKASSSNAKASSSNAKASMSTGKSSRSRGKTPASNSKTSTPTSKPNLAKLTYSIKKPTVVIRKSSRNMKANSSTIEKNITQLDGQTDSDSDATQSRRPNLKKLLPPPPPPLSSPIKTRKQTAKKYTEAETETDDDFEIESPSKMNKSGSPKKLDVRKDVMNLVKKSIVEDDYKLRSNMVKNKRKSLKEEDSDYSPTRKLPRNRTSSEHEFKEKLKVKRRIPPKSELNKSDSNKKEDKKKIGIDLWVEVFVEAEEKWISVDVVAGQIHCVKEIHNRATQPVMYILGWDNEGYIKDITRRYSTSWNTVTRKLRVDNIWLSFSLKSFKGPSTRRDKDENEDLERQQLDQPLPKTISAYKDHPLYVLKKHLLKFQAIYPPDIVPLGYIRNEPVYSRDCLYTLHSRDIWLKQAKVVKLGENPYKIVKARPKYDKLSNKMITDQLLEIFGWWQLQDYEPPTAENGIVPRNAYGNVDLFKSCMLPKGTTQLRLPGLNKIAQRMKIDCAPAVVGFDFHGGFSHPTFDGFVVCKEYEDVLIAGWYMEQEELEKREQEKIDKRVYGNWRRLIKGVLITERMRIKYNMPEKSNKTDNDGKKSKKR